VNLLRLSTGLVAIILGYVGVTAGVGVVAVPAAEAVGQAIFLGGVIRFRRRACPWASRPAVPFGTGRSLVGHGLWLFFGTIAWAVEYHCDTFVIRAVSRFEDVAVFTFWNRFPQLAQAVYANLPNISLPYLTASFVGDPAAAALGFGRIARLGIAIGGILLVCLGTWLPTVVRLWLGSRYEVAHEAAFAACLALTVVLRSFGMVLVLWGQASGRYRFMVLLAWALVGVRLATGWAWVSAVGVHGAAYSGAICLLGFDVVLGGLMAALGLVRVRLLVFAAGVFAGCAALAYLVEPAVGRMSLPGVVFGMTATAAVCGVILLWRVRAEVTRPAAGTS
jgi:O-antigen/teichoic acid export membrane protein